MAAEETRGLLNNLLQWADLQRNQISHKPESIDLKMVSEDIRRLGNAIKFTKSGGRIVLSAQTTAHETIVCVEDNGIGMQMELANTLFD
jgi:signal transduction histidine kinase